MYVDNVLVSYTFQNGWMKNRVWRGGRGGDHSNKSLMWVRESSRAARGQGVTTSYCGPHFNVKVVKNNHNITTKEKKMPLEYRDHDMSLNTCVTCYKHIYVHTESHLLFARDCLYTACLNGFKDNMVASFVFQIIFCTLALKKESSVIGQPWAFIASNNIGWQVTASR